MNIICLISSAFLLSLIYDSKTLKVYFNYQKRLQIKLFRKWCRNRRSRPGRPAFHMTSTSKPVFNPFYDLKNQVNSGSDNRRFFGHGSFRNNARRLHQLDGVSRFDSLKVSNCQATVTHFFLQQASRTSAATARASIAFSKSARRETSSAKKVPFFVRRVRPTVRF